MTSKFITLRAEIIDEHTVMVRGVDFQYMIDRADLKRDGDWSKACTRMLGAIKQRENGRRIAGHNKAEGWHRQANTWAGILRKQTRNSGGTQSGARGGPATDWDTRSVQLLKQLYSKCRLSRLDKWDRWGQNKNNKKRVRVSD
jgi:hypothetical protein